MGLDELEMEEARELVICAMEERGQQETPASASNVSVGGAPAVREGWGQL